MSVNRVLKLRRFLEATLADVHPRIWYEAAPDDAVYPFLVYSLDESFDDGSVETVNLVIDGWDAPVNGDTTELEEIMGKVDNTLHRLNAGDDELFFIFYRSNRRTIHDPDRRLRRRQLEFETKVMGGNM